MQIKYSLFYLINNLFLVNNSKLKSFYLKNKNSMKISKPHRIEHLKDEKSINKTSKTQSELSPKVKIKEMFYL